MKVPQSPRPTIPYSIPWRSTRKKTRVRQRPTKEGKNRRHGHPHHTTANSDVKITLSGLSASNSKNCPAALPFPASRRRLEKAGGSIMAAIQQNGLPGLLPSGREELSIARSI
jgi:hypothetical protein